MISKWLSAFDPSSLEKKNILEAVSKNIDFLKGSVLDIGAGEQPYAKIVKSKTERYTALDLESRGLAKPDVIGNSLRLPFRDGSFDSVLCTQVLEHVVDPFKLFKEVYRVLKHNGRLILTAPQTWPLHEEPNDFFRYTKYGLAQLCRSTGMKVISIDERGGAMVALAQLAGVLFYDRFGAKPITRIPMKVFIIPAYGLAKLLERIWYNPKLTLGYCLIAEKGND